MQYLIMVSLVLFVFSRLVGITPVINAILDLAAGLGFIGSAYYFFTVHANSQVYNIDGVLSILIFLMGLIFVFQNILTLMRGGEVVSFENRTLYVNTSFSRKAFPYSDIKSISFGTRGMLSFVLVVNGKTFIFPKKRITPEILQKLNAIK